MACALTPLMPNELHEAKDWCAKDHVPTSRETKGKRFW